MTPDNSLHQLVFGRDPLPRLVAVEHQARPERVVLFQRDGERTRRSEEAFKPFLWLRDESLLDGFPGEFEAAGLAGGNPLKTLALFESWKEFQKAVAWLKKKTGANPSDPSAPFFLLNDPVQQHLMTTGRTLFKDMRFHDLKRLQVDIETYTDPAFEFPNPERPSDRIIAIALADQTGWTEVLSGKKHGEKELLQEFVRLLAEKDPDVIEGHNLFKFDLPYLQKRAALHGVRLAIGRDGGEPSSYPSRYNIADRTIAYPKFEVFGRHVIDTFFLAQAYDVSHRSLEGLGLKEVAAHFGVSAKGRTYLEGSEIAPTFDRSPQKVMRYAHDDIVETRAVSELLSPSYFVQAQILPFSYQNICVRGSGAKIDALLLREYLHRRHSVPLPDAPREFAGGYTDIFFTGVARNVHHCDIRSLYPSLILQHRLAPSTDALHVFLKLLGFLRELRLSTKEKAGAARSREERIHLDAMQSTLKILINSFYGYLGFSQARFSDYAMAERVAAEGRDLLRKMIDWLRKHDAKPIEIDTDGIYFVPPPFKRAPDLEKFRRALQDSLPEGIDVEFDGEYVSMFSYKMKNYAVLDEHGEIVIKGAALKSRGLEPFQRDFMNEWLRLKLEERDQEIPGLVARYRAAIERREWPIRMLAKTETLQEAPSTYAGKIQGGERGRNAAYELAIASGRDYKAGDQISYYVTGDRKTVAVHGAARLVSEWDPQRRDENTAYYLAKLDALCRKFDAMDEGDVQGKLDFGPAGERTEETEE